MVGFPQGQDDPPETAPVQAPFPVQFEQAATRLELSSRAVKAAEEAAKKKRSAEEGQGGEEAFTGSAIPPHGRELSPEEKKQVEKLKERDQEVRRHEQAHIAASGGHTRGGARYEYQAGPDGKQYAVGGHVSIDVSAVSGDPRATLQKAETVRRAATSPADPSGADMAVAAAAAQMATEAMKQVSRESGAGKAGFIEGEAGRRTNPYDRQAAVTGRRVDARA
jgi:hypothetical protein